MGSILEEEVFNEELIVVDLEEEEDSEGKLSRRSSENVAGMSKDEVWWSPPRLLNVGLPLWGPRIYEGHG